jgi:hypothetical protein
MQYSLACPVQGCNFSVKVNTHNSEWALDKITELSSFHNKQSHPDLPRITHEQIKNIVLSGVQEGMEYD